MRVDLAAQVRFVLRHKLMSSSLAKALKLTGGDEAVETANFIKIVDKLFDCLNVSSLSKGTKHLLSHIISLMTSESM